MARSTRPVKAPSTHVMINETAEYLTYLSRLDEGNGRTQGVFAAIQKQGSEQGFAPALSVSTSKPNKPSNPS